VEYRRFILFMPMLLLALPVLLLMLETTDSAFNSDIALAPYISENIEMRDTIFILSDRYVSVSLKEQTAAVIMRDGTNHAYKISTGNAGIFEGFATPTGIFTVQSKCPLAQSPQFNNAELYHWVGFYYNYGFHGLRTSGYYRHLGKRPSSHGCIRIGRDDARSLYYEVRIGTPVMVFDDEPARIFAFADSSDFNPVYDRYIIKWGDEQRAELASRISNLYTGRARTDQIGRIFMDGKTALGAQPCYGVGLADSIALRQKSHIDCSVKIYSRRDNSTNCSSNYLIINYDVGDSCSTADNSGSATSSQF